MRLYAYAGASTALAAGVVVYAFNERANFYSACVYLAQSNLCLMILTNMILLILASFMFGLQRLFYGPLRQVEIEQLYEKAWFAVTETCLAMTIFREEVGGWFLAMFVSLLVGKVWGWIGEGRVEVLEQQPPANPRLFHTRLSTSLALSVLYDMWILAYTVRTVIRQARPNMMVMFLFEFAILATSSYSTGLRYILSVIDGQITKKQTKERLEQRKSEVRAERAEILSQREAAIAAGEESSGELPDLPSEDDVDEMDIEVPGWEGKGQWMLTLDLATDAVKLCIYMSFFFILLTFYGLPIHIMRDLFLTATSFFRRCRAYVRYRNATHKMNDRYPDATVEELERENTCIICREEMTSWSVTHPAGGVDDPAASSTSQAVTQRTRPKKLPCGHILHLGCLKSWLERQQACPTCRASVVETPQTRTDGTGPQNGAAGRPGAADGARAGPGNPPRVRMRQINLGPFRLAFGQGIIGPQGPGIGPQPAANIPPAAGQASAAPAHILSQRSNTTATSSTISQAQILQMEEQIVNDIHELNMNLQELRTVSLLQGELRRLRALRASGLSSQSQILQNNITITQGPQIQSMLQTPHLSLQRHEAQPGSAAIPSGHSDLPPGVTIPEGWTLLPLHPTNPSSTTIPSLGAQPAGIQPAGASTTGPEPTSTIPTIRPEQSNGAPVTTPLITPTPTSSGQSRPSSSNATASGTIPPFSTTNNPPSSSLPSSLFSNLPTNNAPSTSANVLSTSPSQAQSEIIPTRSNPDNGKPSSGGNQGVPEGTQTSSEGNGKGKATTVEEASDEDA